MRLFFNKELRKLNKIYTTYNNVYESYHENRHKTGELWEQQKKILRGQLIQIGITFDLVCTNIDLARTTFGWIPYTSKYGSHDTDTYTHTGISANIECEKFKDLRELYQKMYQNMGLIRLTKNIKGFHSQKYLWLLNSKYYDIMKEGEDMGKIERFKLTSPRILEEINHLPKYRYIYVKNT